MIAMQVLEDARDVSFGGRWFGRRDGRSTCEWASFGVVSLILAADEKQGLLVGRQLVLEPELHSMSAGIFGGIGMYAEKEVRANSLGDRRAFGERECDIGLSRQCDGELTGFAQSLSQPLGDIQSQV